MICFIYGIVCTGEGFSIEWSASLMAGIRLESCIEVYFLLIVPSFKFSVSFGASFFCGLDHFRPIFM